MTRGSIRDTEPAYVFEDRQSMTGTSSGLAMMAALRPRSSPARERAIRYAEWQCGLFNEVRFDP